MLCIGCDQSFRAYTYKLGTSNAYDSLGGDPTPSPAIPSPANTLESRVYQIFVVNCSGCHSGGVDSGNIGNILDVAQLIASGLIIPGNAAGSMLNVAVQNGRMPLGGILTADDKAKIAAWIDAGAGDFTVAEQPPAAPPKEMNTLLTLDAIAADLRTIPAADRRFMRYLIYTHVYRKLFRIVIAEPCLNSGTFKLKFIIGNNGDNVTNGGQGSVTEELVGNAGLEPTTSTL